jgi:hypothetical protein
MEERREIMEVSQEELFLGEFQPIVTYVQQCKLAVSYYGYASLVVMTSNANTLLIIAVLLNNANRLTFSWFQAV